MSAPCDHLVGIAAEPVEAEGCETCLEIGDTWVHLRKCLSCGRIGCCDDSKNTHARKHAAESGHGVIRSAEPGEFWAWCYEDNVGTMLPS